MHSSALILCLMMTESVRFAVCAAQMVHSNPDCIYCMQRDHLYRTHAGDLKPSWNISLIAHMVKSWSSHSRKPVMKKLFHLGSLLSINPRQMYTFLKCHHTALPETQRYVRGENQTIDSTTITVIWKAIPQRDQWAKLPWRQTLGVAELRTAVSLQEKYFEGWFNPGS